MWDPDISSRVEFSFFGDIHSDVNCWIIFLLFNFLKHHAAFNSGCTNLHSPTNKGWTRVPFSLIWPTLVISYLFDDIHSNRCGGWHLVVVLICIILVVNIFTCSYEITDNYLQGKPHSRRKYTDKGTNNMLQWRNVPKSMGSQKTVHANSGETEKRFMELTWAGRWKIIKHLPDG